MPGGPVIIAKSTSSWPEWGQRGMRYPVAEKLEIIRLVEQSRLPGRPGSPGTAGGVGAAWPCRPWGVTVELDARPGRPHGRRQVRAPWAGGGPDGERGGRPETDASRDHRPLMAL